MRLGELFKHRVETIDSTASVGQAYQRMKQERIQHLVVQNGQKIVGVISDRDLIGKDDVSVAEVMSKRVVFAEENMTLRQAANLMRGHAIHCLPVVDKKGHAIGIVTSSDVLDLIGRGSERPVEQGKRWTLKHRGPRRAAMQRKSRATRGGQFP
jgi:CBS domain-containing protein